MKETQLAPRVLPADVYDALELSALAFGGIGAGRHAEESVGGFNLGSGKDTPCCIFGHALFLDGAEKQMEATRALEAVNITALHPWGDEVASDDAVQAINRRYDVGDIDARVPFQTWCEEVNVVRGS